MKSKYLNIKKIKQPFQQQSFDKNSRKQTKPKKRCQLYQGQQNQTESDKIIHSKSQQYKKSKFSEKYLPKKSDINTKLNPKYKYTETSSQKSQKNQNSEIKQEKIYQDIFQRKRKTDTHQHSHFIGQLNSYLRQLKKSKLDLKQDIQAHQNITLPLKKFQGKKHLKQNQNQQFNHKENKQKQSPKNNLLKQASPLNTNRWQKKIKRQKTINRNLQKCIIQIQKVLWDRNDKLQILQQQLRKQIKQRKSHSSKKFNDILNDKNNFSKTIIFNQKNNPQKKRKSNPKNHIFYRAQSSQLQNSINQFSKISQRNKGLEELLHGKTSKVSQMYRNRDLLSESSTQKQSEATFKQKGRRKTQIQTNLEKILSKTLLNKTKERVQHQKSYNKFINKDLYNI